MLHVTGWWHWLSPRIIRHPVWAWWSLLVHHLLHMRWQVRIEATWHAWMHSWWTWVSLHRHAIRWHTSTHHHLLLLLLLHLLLALLFRRLLLLQLLLLLLSHL